MFDGLEGERGVAEEDAGGPGALGVRGGSGGWRAVREAVAGAGEGDGGEDEERRRGGEVGLRGGRALDQPRRCAAAVAAGRGTTPLAAVRDGERHVCFALTDFPFVPRLRSASSTCLRDARR